MMKLRTFGLVAFVAFAVAFSAYQFLGGSGQSKVYAEVDWDDLIPEGAYDFFQNYSIDYDPTTDAELEAALDNAQRGTVDKLDDTYATIKGFMVPLDLEAEEVTDFMIVPYAAACYHVPPPQPNQTIFASSKVPLKLRSMYDPIEIKGRIELQTAKNDLAESTYFMEVDSIKDEEIE